MFFAGLGTSIVAGRSNEKMKYFWSFFEGVDHKVGKFVGNFAIDRPRDQDIFIGYLKSHRIARHTCCFCLLCCAAVCFYVKYKTILNIIVQL